MRDRWTRHDQLASESVCVCAAADCVGYAPAREMRSRIDRAYDFLTRRFLPNARDEERLRHRMADRDHRRIDDNLEVEEIEALTRRVGALKAKIAKNHSRETLREIRRVLYEITGLLKVHHAGPIALIR
jgi:hypothetical protein